MTTNARHLTDELLHQTLVELAGRPDADALLADVMRSVDAQPQVTRRPWSIGTWQRPMLVLAALLLIGAAAGATIVLSRPSPPPQPTPVPLSDEVITVPDFVVPFTYRVPIGDDGQLGRHGSQDPVVVYSRISGARMLQLFLVSGYVHTCDASNTNGAASDQLGHDPKLLLEGLRDQVGVGMGPITDATLGDLSGFAADIDPAKGSCAAAMLHLDGQGFRWRAVEPTLKWPGRLIVANAGSTLLGVYISGRTRQEVDDWMPIAQAYIDGMAFTGESR